MRVAIVLLIVGTGLVFAVGSRFAALLLYLWFALFRPQEWVWHALDSLRLSLVAGAALVVPAFLTATWPNLTHPLSIGSLALLGTALLAQIFATNPAAGWAALDLLTMPILVSLLMIRLIDSRQRYLWVVMVMAGSMGFYAAKFGVGYILRGGVPNLDGIGGAFGDNNEVGVAFSRALPLIVLVAQNATKKPVQLVSWATIPLGIVGVISTYSRGSFLALMAAGLVFILLQQRRALAIAGIAVFAVGALAVVPIPTQFVERMGTIRTYREVQENSALSRIYFWQVALSMAADNPMGVGLKNYQVVFNEYDRTGGRYGSNRDVHSTHLQALVETGWVGFLVYVWLVGYSLTLLFRIRARSRDDHLSADDRRFLFTTSNALVVSTVAFLVGGTFNSLLINELNWYTFALVAALDRISRQMIRVPGLSRGHATAA